MGTVHRHIILTVLFCVSVIIAEAQQEYQFSQVTKSVEFLNPAYNASKKGANGLILHRNQWMGIEGAPKNIAVNAHLPLKNKKLGFGLIGVGEYVGLRKVLNAGVTADTHVKLGDAGFLAGGLFAGAQVTRYDASEAIAYTNYEGLSEYESINPVTGFGVYFFNQYIHAGAGGFYSISEKEVDAFSENMNVNINLAGIIPLSDKWSLKPYALAKYSTQYMNAYEGGLTVLYDDIVWLGAGYRYHSAVVASIDLRIISNLRIGYSYDHGIGTVSALRASSHEIRLSYELFKDETVESIQFR